MGLGAALRHDCSFLSSVAYVVVGLAGLFQILQWKAIQRRWQADVRMA
jgi:uncharacterized membrane protein YuzA (DUF378 family)